VFEPFTFRLCCFERRFNLFAAFFRSLGALIFVPSDMAANEVNPTSIPVTSPRTGIGSGRTNSTLNDTNQRSASLTTVADKMRPLNFPVASFALTFPNLE
jgi:hypothetical protein